MPYDFIQGQRRSNLSPDPSKEKVNYLESMRSKLTMDPKAMFIAMPPVIGASVPIIEPEYQMITIGSQIWMSRNLDISVYSNGDSIPQVTDAIEWENLTTGAWCYYNNDPFLGAIYGKLYNWYAINDPRGLAPQGLRIPSDTDLTTLSNYLGGESIAGGELKEVGTAHWTNPNVGATNSSGFTALPGGLRDSSSPPIFNDIGIIGYWWYNNILDISNAYGYAILNSDIIIGTGGASKRNGFSVRALV